MSVYRSVSIESFHFVLVQLPVWSFPASTHDARCYSSHCVCSHNICHKCSLCNRNSQSGLLLSCFLSFSLSRYNIFSLLVSPLTFHIIFSLCYDSLVLLYKKENAWLMHKAHLWFLLAFQTWFCEVYSRYNAFIYYQRRLKCTLCSPWLMSLSHLFYLCIWLFSLSSPTFCLSPLSSRFRLYLQTIWLVTSMLHRCRSLNQNSMYSSSF